MDCVKQLPMWAQPVLAVPSFGAAQFTAASGSTIELTSRIPNIFGNDGDYIDFMVFQSSASAWTVFGSTVSPDAIIINANTITITDGTTSDSITLLASLSTTEWNHIRLIRNGSTIECYVATGGDSLVLELQTLDVIPIDIDIIGKNQAAYTDIYSIQFRSAEHSYLSKATPSATVQGADTGFWRYVAFELTEVGNQCIVDHLSGNDGYRIEVENVYLSTHKLKWTVGDGTTTTTKTSDEVFYVGDTVFAYLDLEDLGETTPDEGDTTFDGTYSPNSGTFYVGAQGGTSNFCGMYLHTLLGNDGNLSTTESDWLINSGLGRAIDEIGSGTTVSTTEVGFGYKFNETSGTRADAFGSDDLTENLGAVLDGTYGNGGFETLDAGSELFTGWTATDFSSGGVTASVETTEVNSGTNSYEAAVGAISTTGESNYRLISGQSFVDGKVYDVSIYVSVTDASGSPQVLFDNSGNGGTELDITLTQTAFLEYTGEITSDGTSMYFRPRTSSTRTYYFDDITISPQKIDRAFGLRTSFLTSANCTLYMRNVMIVSSFFSSSYPMHGNANDAGNDGNDGTASNVTWVTTDPVS